MKVTACVIVVKNSLFGMRLLGSFTRTEESLDEALRKIEASYSTHFMGGKPPPSHKLVVTAIHVVL
jgi:hypothetical protein